MANFVVMAKLLGGDEKAVGDHAILVETFDISASRWRAISEGKTNRSGVLKVEVSLRQSSHGTFLPSLRLVEEGDGARVLSSGPMVTTEGRGRQLIVDFGEIEYLDDASFPRRDTGGEERDIIAGLARKTGLPQTKIIREIEANPNTGILIAREDARLGSAIVTRDTNTGATLAGSTNVGAALTRGDLDPKASAEIQTMHAINLNNTAKLAEKDRIIAAREHELSLKTNELQSATERATAAETKLAETQSVNKGKEADIQNVFANIGTQISGASTALKTTDNPFRIGSVKVDLKGALAENGKIVLGGDRVDGSGVSVEMTPEGTTRGETDVTVPDVTGLTQSAARRVLRSVGLRLKAASQSMKPGETAHGQSMRQTPLAGTSLAHGGDVLVVFATVSET